MKSSDEISTKFVVRSNFKVRSGRSGTCHIGFCISSGWRSYKKKHYIASLYLFPLEQHSSTVIQEMSTVILGHN